MCERVRGNVCVCVSNLVYFEAFETSLISNPPYSVCGFTLLFQVIIISYRCGMNTG